MEIFWNTIASYNAATWPVQILLTLVAATLTLLLYLRPTPGVRIAMKTFMAMLNFWIAGIYYLLYGEQREHNDMLALFWAIMGCIWVYDLVVKHASLQRTHNHTGFALLLFAMPLVYPLFSLALGRTFPMVTTPVMPCSVAVFTIGLMLVLDDNHIENIFTLPRLKSFLVKARYDIGFDVAPQELEMHLQRVEKMGHIIENYCGLRLELYKELSERQ